MASLTPAPSHLYHLQVKERVFQKKSSVKGQISVSPN